MEDNTCYGFSMWRIESELQEAGAPYDRRAALYDRLVRSPLYNRLAWSTSPQDYADFAAQAIGSSDGPILEAAAGSAAATAALHVRSGRPTVLVDMSRAMLERAAARIAAASEGDAVPSHIRLVQADLQALKSPPRRFSTVLALGLGHLFDDVPALLSALRAQLEPGGELYLAGLVAETRRGRRYLSLLHRAGEAAAPRSGAQFHEALGSTADFRVIGCMAYARLASG